jgi:hypothetical protein
LFSLDGHPVNPEQKASLNKLQFMPSRIPALDALATFVPTGNEGDPVVTAATGRAGFSRWFPVSGGHRLLVPFEGGEYDTQRFTIESKAWDHETCKVCRSSIPAMTLCWVAQSGAYIILCQSCYTEVFPDAPQTI